MRTARGLYRFDPDDADDRAMRDELLSPPPAPNVGKIAALDRIAARNPSPFFVTNPETWCAELDDAAVAVIDRDLRDVDELVPLLESVIEASRPLLIAARSIRGDALATIVANKLRGIGYFAAVECEASALLAIARAATCEVVHVIPELARLGRAKRIVIGDDALTITS